MPLTTKFNAALPVTPLRIDRPICTITASIVDNLITITDTDIIGRDSRARTYHITAEDDETFTIPDDLHQSTINMLIGVGQRLMYLKRWGFDREP